MIKCELSSQRGLTTMPTEKEAVFIQKATVYDLMRIIKEHPGKTYTQEELEKLFDAYITGVEQ